MCARGKAKHAGNAPTTPRYETVGDSLGDLFDRQFQAA